MSRLRRFARRWCWSYVFRAGKINLVKWCWKICKKIFFWNFHVFGCVRIFWNYFSVDIIE